MSLPFYCARPRRGGGLVGDEGGRERDGVGLGLGLDASRDITVAPGLVPFVDQI